VRGSTQWGEARGGFRRYSATRPCPGCEAAGERRDNRCRAREHERGTLLECSKLTSAPAGWEPAGVGGLGAARYFIPNGTAAPERLLPSARRQPSRPHLEGEKLRAFVANLLEVNNKLARTFERDVSEFYADREVLFDVRLYRVGPSYTEAKQVADAMLALGHLNLGTSHALPGFDYRGGLDAHTRGEAWELVLDDDGRTVGWSRRFLHPSAGEQKSKLPLGSRHRLHHSIGWREAVKLHGVLVVTEGVRKANEIARRTGYAALGVPGIYLSSVRREIESAVRSSRPRLLLLAPDFGDVVDGEPRHDGTRQVIARWQELGAFVEPHGGELRALAWNERDGKGLDDALRTLGHEGVGLPAEVRALGWREHAALWRWHDSTLAPASESETRPRVGSFEPQQATRELVRTADDALRVSREIAESWKVGVRSLHFAGWPGLGKTRALLRFELEGLAKAAPGFEQRVAALALPTRALVHEKATLAREMARELRLDVEVLEVLGRGDASSGWECESPDRARLRAELKRPACAGCEMRARCENEPGRYRHSRDLVVQAMRDASAGKARPALIVGTLEAVRHLRELPDAAALVLDDCDPSLLLVRTERFLRLDIESERDRLEQWTANLGSAPVLVSGDVVPEAHAARFVLEALDTLLESHGVAKFAALVRGYAPTFLEALRENKVRPADPQEGWPWETWQENVGPDDRPAFSGLVLELARELLERDALPVVRWISEAERRGRNLPDLEVRMPDRRLLERVRAGRVAWLTVAPLPRMLAEALNVQAELVHAAPEGLRVEVLEHRLLAQDGKHERLESFSSRSSQGDEVVRGLVRALAAKVPTLGAVVNKADREPLGDLLGERLVHYGAGHAGTDALAGCAELVVRRFIPPFAELAHEAEAWRQLLGLPASVAPGAIERELRRWNDAHEGVESAVPADALERELLEAHEAHGMLNACGRGRPLSAGAARRVLVLNGRPFNLHGAPVTVRQLADFARAEGLELDLPTEDARRTALEALNADKAARFRELLERTLALLEENPMASRRWLGAQLGTSDKVTRGLLLNAREGIRSGLDRKRQTVLALLAKASGQIGPTSDREKNSEESLGSSIHRGADVGKYLPTFDEVRLELADEMPRQTLRRHYDAVREALEHGAAIVPARSDAAVGLDAVLSALVRLLEGRVLVLLPHVPASAGALWALPSPGWPLAVGADPVPVPVPAPRYALQL